METTEKPTTLSLGAAMAAEIMIGFWLGIGVILAVKMEYCIEELISRKYNGRRNTSNDERPEESCSA